MKNIAWFNLHFLDILFFKSFKSLKKVKWTIPNWYATRHNYKFSPEKFELIAITLNSGKINNSPLYKLCNDLEIEFHEIKTDIQEIAFDIIKEKNLCFLCAKLMRGILNTLVK